MAAKVGKEDLFWPPMSSVYQFVMVSLVTLGFDDTPAMVTVGYLYIYKSKTVEAHLPD